MGKRTYRAAFGAGTLFAACGLLAACGVTPDGALQAGRSAAPSVTVVVGGTPGTLRQITPCATSLSAKCAPSPSASASGQAQPGAVRLTLDKTSYAPGSQVLVRIENGLGVPITVTDHQTNCTFVQLQRHIGDWQPVGRCPLMTPTRMVDLASGSVTDQKIVIPSGPQAAGTYRVVLVYLPDGNVPGKVGNTAYSASFTVG